MNMLTNFKLRGPRVLVRQLQAITMRESGIILAETQTTEVHHRGIVERVGPGETLESGAVRPVQDLKAGDLVYFAQFAGTNVVLDGQTRLMLMEDEIQGAVDASHVNVVQHLDEAKDGSKDHLADEPCAICLGPAESQARESLSAMREQMVNRP